MKRTTRLIVRLLRYFRDELWLDGNGGSRVGGLCRGVIKRVVLSVRCFLRERLTYQASALTYSTLLSIVPLLAIVFAIAKGFGLNRLVEETIRTNFRAQGEVVDVLIGFVNSYLMHTKSGVFLGFGILLLLWSLISLTNGIEVTFNRIWQVKHERSTFRMATDYTAMFFLIPIFILLTSGLSIFLSTSVEQLPDFLLLRPATTAVLRLVPYALVGLLFTGLYMFMPNTRVRFRSAAIAGFLAGAAFQGLQFFYIHSQMWVSGYNAIYGSFAALPLFMLWCQISWYICLFGATLSYVDQNIDYFYQGRELPGLSRRQHDFLCLLIASFVCRRFADARPPYDAITLSREKQIPIRLVNDVLYELCAAGVLVAVAGDEKDTSTTYLPARDIHGITVGSVLGVLEERGTATLDDDLGHYDALWTRYTAYCRDALADDYASKKLIDFEKLT